MHTKYIKTLISTPNLLTKLFMKQQENNELPYIIMENLQNLETLVIYLAESSHIQL